MNISQYFEKRMKTYPQHISGKFRKIKDISSIIFLSIFLFFPFIRWERGVNMSDQAILVDIVNGRGYFFFIKIWPEEVYYLTGILIFAAIALFFVTSLFGRVWCGYSCPQTVWTDIFVKIERLFQGDRNKRIQLDRRKTSLEKFARKFYTQTAWIIVSLITGFGFVLYFNDAFLLTKQLTKFELSPATTGWILGVGFMTYIMAGFAREQVCNYMCPYSRFQSAMFDKDTLIVSYDEKRGESRAKAKVGDSFKNRGHCIDCKQCVVVCPQNIDIRNGLQMECIACGLCIDACDKIMKKMSLPTGLIRYDTMNNMANPTRDNKFRILRSKTFYYIFILLIIGGFILFNLSNRSLLELNLIRSKNPLFVTLSDGRVRNSYALKIQNKSNQDRFYILNIEGIDNLEYKIQGVNNSDFSNLKVKSDSVANFKIFVTSNKNNLNESGRTKIKFTVIDNKDGNIVDNDSVFIDQQ